MSSHSPFVLRTIYALAILALLIGVGTALVSVVAPLGVWLQAWDFRQGFSILRNVNNIGIWLVAAVLAMAAVVCVSSPYFYPSKQKRLITLALVGAVAVSLAYYIPVSYRPAADENIPPIHDISTDTENPPQFVVILPLRADAPNSTEYGSGPNMTAEKLAQLQTGAYPDIQPKRYTASKEAVFNAALAAANELGWDLVAQDFEAGRIEATDTTFWFRFKDDVVILIEEDGQAMLVNARSVSRVGVGDVGTNAKRLRDFFTKMDAMLK